MDNSKNWYALLLSILTVATCEEALLIIDPDVNIRDTNKTIERIKDPKTIERRSKYTERKGGYVPIGTKCSYDGCTNIAKPFRMRCEQHIQIRIPTAQRGNCSIPGCEKIEYAKSFCYQHYQKSREVPCKTENCKNIANRRGYCSKCFIRLKKEGNIDEINKKNTNVVLDFDR